MGKRWPTMLTMGLGASFFFHSYVQCERPETCSINDPLGQIKYELSEYSKTKIGVKGIKAYSCAAYAANQPMEDRYDMALDSEVSGDAFVAVFDGHGGWQAAEFAKEHLIANAKLEIEHTDKVKADQSNSLVLSKALIRSFERTDRDLLVQLRHSFQVGFGHVARVGSCALLAFLRDDLLIVANAGDVRAVIGKMEDGNIRPIVMSDDHNAKIRSEQERLMKEHPGEPDIVRCKHPEACYVKGRLQPTRSLGDFYLKHSEFNGPEYRNGDRSRGRHIPPPYTPPYIHATPEIKQHQLTTADKFMVIGSDGLWDFLENDEAVQLVHEAMETGIPEHASKYLIERVLEKSAARSGLTLQDLLLLPGGRDRRQRHDDTTVVVIYFD